MVVVGIRLLDATEYFLVSLLVQSLFEFFFHLISGGKLLQFLVVSVGYFGRRREDETDALEQGPVGRGRAGMATR